MRRRHLVGLVVLASSVLLAADAQAQAKPPQAAAPAAAQLTPASFAGRYEGTAVTPDGVQAFVADFRVDKGVITGTITTSTTTVSVTGGTAVGDKLNLSIDMDGAPGTMAGTFKDGKYEGQWAIGADGGAFTMKKASGAAAAPTAPAPVAAPAPPVGAPKPAGAAPAAGTDPLTGDWDAVIDVGGNQMPFTLTAKLDGQKVTGQLSSEQGTLAYEGTWTNGTLSFSFTTQSGMGITMTATLVDGKLAGTFSMADGQFSGGWAAAKRK